MSATTLMATLVLAKLSQKELKLLLKKLKIKGWGDACKRTKVEVIKDRLALRARFRKLAMK